MRRATLVLGAVLAGAAWSPSAAGAVDRVYVADADFHGRIAFAALDASGAGQLDISGATANMPYGVAIDSAAGRIYWAGAGGRSRSRTSTEAAAAATLNTTSATVHIPAGAAIDPVARRIYWANLFANKTALHSLRQARGRLHPPWRRGQQPLPPHRLAERPAAGGRQLPADRHPERQPPTGRRQARPLPGQGLMRGA